MICGMKRDVDRNIGKTKVPNWSTGKIENHIESHSQRLAELLPDGKLQEVGSKDHGLAKTQAADEEDEGMEKLEATL